MAIEIELTPRKLERIVFMVIILIFMSTTIYYSYKYSQCSGGETDNITGDVIGLSEVEEKEKTKVEEVIKTEPETKTETTAKKDLSGNVDITIAVPISYTIKESAVYKKAVISSLSFIIYNGLDSNLQMKVKIYHSNSKTSEEYNGNPRTTLEFPAIGAGDHKTKTFFDISGLNLYNFELDQSLKFVFEDSDGNEIKTLTKILKIE